MRAAGMVVEWTRRLSKGRPGRPFKLPESFPSAAMTNAPNTSEPALPASYRAAASASTGGPRVLVPSGIITLKLKT